MAKVGQKFPNRKRPVDTTEFRLLKYLPERFEGQCWLWTSSVNTDGYGTIRPTRGKTTCVHILMYTRHIGPVPEGLELDHICGNRRCCNPKHLEPVTHRENVLRGNSPSALCARKTHCACGLELVPYTGARKKLKRWCPPCWKLKAKLAQRKWRAENKQCQK